MENNPTQAFFGKFSDITEWDDKLKNFDEVIIDLTVENVFEIIEKLDKTIVFR